MIPAANQPDVTGRLTVILSDGARISVRRWGAERERRILLSHGNGLAADGFWTFGRELTKSFEVFAFDLRNHGENLPVEQAEMPWPRYIADIPEIFDAIIDEFGSKETHGAFHSMSSACVLAAQTRTPRPWSSLTLFEPPLAPSIDPLLAGRFDAIQEGLGERTRRRRRAFKSPEDLARSFLRAKAFEGIDPETILRLAAATLRPEGDTWELACSPDHEASNFVTAGMLAQHWPDFARIDRHVQIMLGDLTVHDMPILVELGRLLAETFRFSLRTCPGDNHFMQLRHPERCAKAVIEFAAANSEATSIHPL